MHALIMILLILFQFQVFDFVVLLLELQHLLHRLPRPPAVVFVELQSLVESSILLYLELVELTILQFCLEL